MSINENNPQEQTRTRRNWLMVKPWLGVAGLVGAGFLPCPECGAPLIWHFWPIAAVLAWRNMTHSRRLHTHSDNAEDN